MVILKNTVEPDRPQMTIWPMRIACWIPKATNVNSDYVILIPLPEQQWLHEHFSLLLCMYIAFLFCYLGDTVSKHPVYKLKKRRDFVKFHYFDLAL